MNIERKKEMLQLAHSISMDVNNQNCGNYISKVINAIDIAEKRGDTKLFLDVLKKMKYTSFGGRKQEDGFRLFVDEIMKNPIYKIHTLNFEELKFIFQWVRRLVKTKIHRKDERKSSGREYYSRREDNSYRRNSNVKNNGRKRNRVYEDQDDNMEDSPFAKLALLKK